MRIISLLAALTVALSTSSASAVTSTPQTVVNRAGQEAQEPHAPTGKSIAVATTETSPAPMSRVPPVVAQPSTPAITVPNEQVSPPPSANPFPPVTTTAYSPPVDDAAFYGDEAGLQRQLRLLTLRSKIAELKKKLGEDSASSANGSASPVAVLPTPMTAQQSTDAHDPNSAKTIASIALPVGHAEGRSSDELRLVSVIGVAGNYEAVVSVGLGDMPVRIGSVLSNGWLVREIGPTSISLTKGRHHKTLVVGN